jgi:hypothetical protein
MICVTYYLLFKGSQRLQEWKYTLMVLKSMSH